MTLPLDGVRILALDHYYAGNVGSQILRRFGAEVLKIELPQGGDSQRRSGPVLEGENGSTRSLSEMRLMLGKKSIAIDVSMPEGKALLLDLVAKVDMVWTNLKPSSLRRMGLTFEALCKANPEIVYTTISGFGHADLSASGPMGDWTALDIIAQGLAGLQFRTQADVDEPRHNGLAVAGQLTAIQAVFASVLALYRRGKDHAPQRVDVAMHDVMLFLNESSLSATRYSRTPPARGVLQEDPVSDWLRCSDGFINIVLDEDTNWMRLADIATHGGQPIADARTGEDAHTGRSAPFKAIVAAWASRLERDDVVEILRVQGVACAPVLTLPQALRSAQSQARGMIFEVSDPNAGRCRVIGNPIKMSDVADIPQGKAPFLGEHSREILTTLLNLSPARIEDLIAQAVVGDR